MLRARQTRNAFKSAGASAARVLLKEQAYQQLKSMIQTGAVAPYATLSERQLAERLGMSKTPIRAALENLENQGLVSVSPQKGILIRELSAREIAELFDVRLAIEPFVAAQLARSSLARPQCQSLKENLRRQRAAVKDEDPLAATELDIAFHRLLAELLDNREISIWLERCFDKLHRSVLHINRLVPGRLHKSFEDHEAIGGAIMKGLHEKAARLMTAHLGYGRRFLLGGGTA
jgi:DNA-binding GntR family transcriptional regulator